jgi:hypothetical protein
LRDAAKQHGGLVEGVGMRVRTFVGLEGRRHSLFD